jgi:hypothetical protein
VRIGKVWAAALALAFLAAPLPAFAAPLLTLGEGPDLLAGGIGVYDVLHDNKAAQFRLEYRFAYRFFYILQPIAGILATSDGTIFAHAGVHTDFVLAEHYVLMPVATVGYWQRGGGKDLGAHIEFKTGGEFAYRFDNKARVGLAFDHISNAGIGKKNPGVESLLLVYSLPL